MTPLIRTAGATPAANVAAPTSRPWPSRKEWAVTRRTSFADDVQQVTDMTSADPATYASTEQIAQAVDELRAHWRQLGTELRAANTLAKEIFPMHGKWPSTAEGRAAMFQMLEDLSPEQTAIIDRATMIRDHRARVREAVRGLSGENRQLRLWVCSRVLLNLPAGSCPEWRAIVSRWLHAREQAAAGYRAGVECRPVDDAAWRKELARRAGINAARSTGWTVGAAR
jgi:hypothetical protein